MQKDVKYIFLDVGSDADAKSVREAIKSQLERS